MRLFEKFYVLQGEADGGDGLGGGGGAGGNGDGGPADAGQAAGAAGEGGNGDGSNPSDGGNSPPAGAAGAGGAGDWPDDWRTRLSADGKHSKTLDRFASPNALLDSYIALRQKVDSGELRAISPFPDKGTADEQVAWRKAHGIPEKPEDYSLSFGDGLVIGEQDKPIIEGFLKAAHGANIAPEQVKGVLQWYYEQQESNLAQIEERDTATLTQTEDSLRAEWGGEYRTNINMIKGLIDTLPESVRDSFMGARLADGTALLNHPDMARWLAGTARTINPVHTVVPGAGANVAGAIDDEIASIEKVMREDRSRYNGNEKMQARLRELYSARERAR